MAFRINNTCDTWFSNIADREPLKRKFDYYYLCALLGLAAGQKTAPGEDAREFVDEFINSYRPYQRQLIGLLILSQLHALGIPIDDKPAVTKQVAALVTTNRSSQLTEEGFQLLNSYSFGGFRLLHAEMEKPHDITFFLREYHLMLDQKIQRNPALAAARPAVV